jgi:tetratricopeptide (TPR) repeat protein
MPRLVGRGARVAVLVASFCMPAMGQQAANSFPGIVQKVGGAGLPHATVRIDGAGSTETSDSGEFSFPLSGNLKVGYPAVFHVSDWVILKPCELKNGRAYLHDAGAEPIEIVVLPQGDPRLKSAIAVDSMMGCVIQEEVSQLPQKSRPGTGPHAAPAKQGYLPRGTGTDRKEYLSQAGRDREAAPERLREAAYHLPANSHTDAPANSHATENSSLFSAEKPKDAAEAAREEFLAKKAKELGFSVAELKSAIETWSKAVEDPYQRGLAALYDKRYAEASKYISESLKTPKGNDVTHYVQLGAAEYWQGKYAAAESDFRKVLAAYPQDPIVLNSLAEALRAEARYSEAEQLEKQAAAIDEKTWGPESTNVAVNLNNLGLICLDTSRYTEAEPLFKRALAIDEKALGPDNPSVATNLDNLAELYHDEGRYNEAEPLYKRASAIYEKVLGPEDTDLATNLSNLGELYDDEGRYAEAEPLLKRALAIHEKALGPDHPDVATDVGNLAEIYHDEMKLSEAEPLYKRALAIHEKTMGPDHPDTATDVGNLAELYHDLGKYKEAEPLYKRAIAIDEKMLGTHHTDYALNLNNLAGLYEDEGKYAEAEPLYKQALAIVQNVDGPNHPDVAEYAENLARTLHKLGRDAEAKPYEVEAAEIRKNRKQ